MQRRLLLCASLALAGLSSAVSAQEAVLNIYSARHYQTDEALYANFTKQTGIKINRLDGKEDELVERIRNEGKASPADVLITVDAARLEVADSLGLFQPVKSAVLEARVPAGLRTPTWFSFSTRALEIRKFVAPRPGGNDEAVRRFGLDKAEKGAARRAFIDARNVD